MELRGPRVSCPLAPSLTFFSKKPKRKDRFYRDVWTDPFTVVIETLKCWWATAAQWRHVITDCVCLVTEMASFISLCISSWPSRRSCFSSSTWAQLPSLVCLSPTITLSPRLASPLSLSPFLSFPLTDTGHRSLP